MGGASSTHGGERKCFYGFGGETWRKETTWKVKCNITMDPKERGWDGCEWIDLAPDKEKGQSSEHGNENSGLLKWGKFFVFLRTINFKKGVLFLGSIELVS